MLKVAIVVLADTETLGDLGRVVNALQAVKEFKESGDEVQLVFDGAGTKWIPEFSKPDHKYKPLFSSVQDKIVGVCSYCANAYGVQGAVHASGYPAAADYESHPSFRQMALQGYQVITF